MILQWDTLLLAYFANKRTSTFILEQNTQALSRLLGSRSIRSQGQKESHNLKKKICLGESIADVPTSGHLQNSAVWNLSKMTATPLLHAKKELIYGYIGRAQDGLMDALLCRSMPTE